MDVVLDPVGANYLADNLRVLGLDGRLVLIGLLGAATAFWQAGRRGSGAALAGATMIGQVMGPVTVQSLFDREMPDGQFLTLLAETRTALIVVAVVGALGAIVLSARRPGPPLPVPSWRPHLKPRGRMDYMPP